MTTKLNINYFSNHCLPPPLPSPPLKMHAFNRQWSRNNSMVKMKHTPTHVMGTHSWAILTLWSWATNRTSGTLDTIGSHNAVMPHTQGQL